MSWGIRIGRIGIAWTLSIGKDFHLLNIYLRNGDGIGIGVVILGVGLRIEYIK